MRLWLRVFEEQLLKDLCWDYLRYCGLVTCGWWGQTWLVRAPGSRGQSPPLGQVLRAGDAAGDEGGPEHGHPLAHDRLDD